MQIFRRQLGEDINAGDGVVCNGPREVMRQYDGAGPVVLTFDPDADGVFYDVVIDDDTLAKIVSARLEGHE